MGSILSVEYHSFGQVKFPVSRTPPFLSSAPISLCNAVHLLGSVPGVLGIIYSNSTVGSGPVTLRCYLGQHHYPWMAAQQPVQFFLAAALPHTRTLWSLFFSPTTAMINSFNYVFVHSVAYTRSQIEIRLVACCKGQKRTALVDEYHVTRHFEE